jgi:hypothetical protein
VIFIIQLVSADSASGHRSGKNDRQDKLIGLRDLHGAGFELLRRIIGWITAAAGFARQRVAAGSLHRERSRRYLPCQ